MLKYGTISMKDYYKAILKGYRNNLLLPYPYHLKGDKEVEEFLFCLHEDNVRAIPIEKSGTINEVIAEWNKVAIHRRIKKILSDYDILKYSTASVLCYLFVIFNFTEMLNFVDNAFIMGLNVIMVLAFVISLSFSKKSDYYRYFKKLIIARVKRTMIDDIKRFLKKNDLPYAFFEQYGYIKTFENYIDSLFYTQVLNNKMNKIGNTSFYTQVFNDINLYDNIQNNDFIGLKEKEISFNDEDSLLSIKVLNKKSNNKLDKTDNTSLDTQVFNNNPMNIEVLNNESNKELRKDLLIKDKDTLIEVGEVEDIKYNRDKMIEKVQTEEIIEEYEKIESIIEKINKCADLERKIEIRREIEDCIKDIRRIIEMNKNTINRPMIEESIKIMKEYEEILLIYYDNLMNKEDSYIEEMTELKVLKNKVKMKREYLRGRE